MKIALKKARTCTGCWAYEESSGSNPIRGYCSLGFNVEQLPRGKSHAGRTGAGQYWSFYCKPAEPCMKPLTSREAVACFKEKYKT